jgi:methionine aminotransferase
MKIVSKLPHIGVTIFAVMTALANKHGAINLSQGFPDFDVPTELIDLVTRHMRSARNQYAPMQGVEVLREAVCKKVASIYGAAYDSNSEITVTSGATEALFAAITACVRPGDEVIVFEPAYDAYVPVIQLNGGIPVFIEMDTPGYTIDWNKVRDAVTDKTKLFVLNSPHNPTGAVLTSKDIAALIDIVHNTDILIVSDEVYEHILFDGLQHESMCRYPELAARSFVISSFGKTYHATGWKIGYCLAPKPLTKEFQKIHQFLTYASNTPIQYAYGDYLQHRSAYESLPAFYQKKRDLFLSLVEASRFKPIPCHGTYFQLLEYSDMTDEPDVSFAERLTIEHGVASIPTSVFYHRQTDHKVLRFCFAKKDDTLKEAAEKLCRI